MGICLTVANLISLPLPLLVGMLVDRIGSRLVVVIGLLLQGAGFLGYLAVRTPFWLVIAALTVAVGVRFFWSAVFTLVTERSEPERRDHWFGIFGAVQNAGIGVGSLISAGLVLLGTHAAYHFVIVVNGLSFVVAAAVVMLVGQSGNPATHEKEANEPSVPLGRNRPYLALIGINTIFALCSVMLGVGVPIYVDLGLHQPGWVTGVLFRGQHGRHRVVANPGCQMAERPPPGSHHDVFRNSVGWLGGLLGAGCPHAVDPGRATAFRGDRRFHHGRNDARPNLERIVRRCQPGRRPGSLYRRFPVFVGFRERLGAGAFHPAFRGGHNPSVDRDRGTGCLGRRRRTRPGTPPPGRRPAHLTDRQSGRSSGRSASVPSAMSSQGISATT
ncbi:MFS transporter [Fodinicola feengrottensis]|uniref:MFS transporter n=1 Tax=Fodinicola feengrottensis TaxID=435914 RepID=UPI0013D6336C|nr:MFS transporter [Fodinicola feengrottensis]